MYGNPALGQWVRRRRAALGLTQAALAAQIDCSLSLVRKLERGERRPPPDVLPRLLDLLDAGPAERAAFLPAEAGAPPRDEPHVRRPGAVPAPPNRLIGREADQAAVTRRLMGDTRLLTICGAPGIGKTRLAQHVAAELLPLFDGAISYVSLAPVADASRVPEAIATALGLWPRPDTPLADQIIDYLHARRALLVLDNCEHLLAAAPLFATLLESSPRLQLLATSREPLRLRAEQIFPLAPLDVPESSDPAAVARAPAARLLADRARALNPAFALDATNAAAVAVICARLDGLPLAIELAAGRLDALSPAALLDRLDPRLPLLADGPRDLPARQRTLHDAIAWSYDLLEPAAQAAFNRMGVFVGGCTTTAAYAVCAAPGDTQAAPDIRHLVEASLIQQRDGRLLMLETIREFALEQLAKQGEPGQWRHRHAGFFAELAEQAEQDLTGPDAVGWFDRLEADLPNLRAAMGWSLAHDGGLCAARIIAALLPFWRVRGHFHEGRALEASLLDPGSRLPPLIRAKALYTVGFLASQRSDLRCIGLLDVATTLFQQAGDKHGAVRCLNLQGLLARRPPSYHQAVTLHQQALTLARSLEDSDVLGSALNNLGLALACLARYDEAIGHYDEAITIARTLGHQSRIAERLPNWAEALLLRGDHAAAAATYEEALVIARAIGHREVIAEAQDGLGRLALLRGDLAAATALLTQSLAIYEEMGLLFAIIRLRRNLGYLALRHGEPHSAAEQFRASLTQAVLPGFADMAAHALAGLAQALALTGATERAATLAAGTDALRQRYNLRAEPEDAELCAALATLAATHPGAWAAGLAEPTEQLITAALHDDLESIPCN